MSSKAVAGVLWLLWLLAPAATIGAWFCWVIADTGRTARVAARIQRRRSHR